MQQASMQQACSKQAASMQQACSKQSALACHGLRARLRWSTPADAAADSKDDFRSSGRGRSNLATVCAAARAPGPTKAGRGLLRTRADEKERCSRKSEARAREALEMLAKEREREREREMLAKGQCARRSNARERARCSRSEAAPPPPLPATPRGPPSRTPAADAAPRLAAARRHVDADARRPSES